MRARGFTLVEMMIAASTAMIGLTAATIVLVGFSGFQRRSKQTLGMNVSAQSGLATMTRDGENHGSWFPGTEFYVPGSSWEQQDGIPNGLVMWDNITTDDRVALDDGDDIQVVAGDSSEPGAIAGTDIFETTVGRPMIGHVALTDGNNSTPSITLEGQDPLIQAVDSSHYPLLLFVNPDNPNQNCLGYPLTISWTAQAVLTVQRRSLRDMYGLVAGTFPNFPSGCPAVGMNVYAVDKHRRFLVYQDAPSGQLVRGLYVQEGDSTGTFPALPKLLVPGVTNLQVTWLGDNRMEIGKPFDPLKDDCSGHPMCPVLVQAGENGANFGRLLRFIMGAEIRLTARGKDPKPLNAPVDGRLANEDTNFESHHTLRKFSTTVHFRNLTGVDL